MNWSKILFPGGFLICALHSRVFTETLQRQDPEPHDARQEGQSEATLE